MRSRYSNKSDGVVVNFTMAIEPKAKGELYGSKPSRIYRAEPNSSVRVEVGCNRCGCKAKGNDSVSAVSTKSNPSPERERTLSERWKKMSSRWAIRPTNACEAFSKPATKNQKMKRNGEQCAVNNIITSTSKQK